MPRRRRVPPAAPARFPFDGAAAGRVVGLDTVLRPRSSQENTPPDTGSGASPQRTGGRDSFSPQNALHSDQSAIVAPRRRGRPPKHLAQLRAKQTPANSPTRRTVALCQDAGDRRAFSRLSPNTPSFGGIAAIDPAAVYAQAAALQHDDGTPQRPAVSYTTLITDAISSSPRGRMLLSEIYQHIMEHNPYYRAADPGWKNSVRHALSSSPVFVNLTVPAGSTAHRATNGRRRFEWALRARLAGTEGAIVAQRRGAVRTYREKAPRTDTWCFVQPCDASPYLGTGDAYGSGAQKVLRDDTRDPFLTASPVPTFGCLAAPGLRTIGIDADSQDQAVVDVAPDAALDTPILWSTE